MPRLPHACTFLLFFCLLQASTALAQHDAHYWSFNYGTKGQILNGAVIAGVDDNSAIYYNPSAIGLDTTNGLSLSLLSPYASIIHSPSAQLENQGIITDLELIPNVVAFEYDLFKNPKINTGGMLMTRHRHELSLTNSLGTVAGPELQFTGSVNYRSLLTDTWGGVGIAYHFSEDFSIGLSQFVTFRNQSQMWDFERSTFTRGSMLDYARNTHQFEYGINFGFITKAGLSWRFENLDVGLTLTTPQYAVIHKWADVQFSRTEYVADTLQNESTTIDKPEAIRYKTPWAVGVGLVWHFSEKEDHCVSTSIEHFTEVPRYALLEHGITVGAPYRLETVARSVTNVAVGYERKVNNYYTLLAGFSTDFNHSPDAELKRGEAYEITNTHWNLYHLSVGGHFNIQSFRFSAGLDYGFSDRADSPFLFPYSNPDKALGFQLFQDDPSHASYKSLALYLNYGYLF